MIGETMEDMEDMTEPSDLVYREKRPRTEPWGMPVVRVHCAGTNLPHVTWQEWPAR